MKTILSGMIMVMAFVLTGCAGTNSDSGGYISSASTASGGGDYRFMSFGEKQAFKRLVNGK